MEKMDNMSIDSGKESQRDKRGWGTMGSSWVSKAVVLHGVSCCRPAASLLQDVVRAFTVVWVFGVRWLLGWRRRKGKQMSLLVVFFDRAITFNRAQLPMGGRRYNCEGYEFDRKSERSD